MKISKRDARMWYSFFAQLPEEEQLSPRQMELAWAVIAQIEDAVEAESSRLMAQIPGLKNQQGRTFYVGQDEKFPGGCKSCLLGTGLSAVRKTNRCNINCKFCYNYGEMEDQPPIGENMWEIGGCKFRTEDIPLLLSIQKKPTGIAYVYLEPFMEIEKYYPVVKHFSDAGVHQHLYTNGTLCTEENLKALGESGLNELRFNLGATNCADRVIECIGIAKKYIPKVGIETPMTPEFFESFLQKKDQILSTGLDFINCAELHLNANNIENYAGENMYMSRHGYVSPIWSHQMTLRFMRMAAEENWPVVVHDCCNRTKFTRDLHLKAQEGGWFGQSSYGMEFDRIPFEAFLPTLEDEDFHFLMEEELPAGFRPGDMVF